MPAEGAVTRLLGALRRGDPGAFDQLMPLVYRELRERAHRQLAARRPGETLDTTALVNETYLKLVDAASTGWQDRAHFFAVASKAMRQIIVDYARRSAAKKRGGPVRAPLLDRREEIAAPVRAAELLELDEALKDLERLDERLSRIVELRFFGGLSVEEAAEVLDVSPRTVKRDWRKARALLYEAIRADGGP